MQFFYKGHPHHFPEAVEQIFGGGNMGGRADKTGGLYQLEQVWDCLLRDKIQYHNRKSRGSALSLRLIGVGLAVHPCR